MLDPGQATAEDCRRYVRRGNMWVWDENGTLLGFSAATGDTGWIWALFVRPEHEGHGIGRALFVAACDALTTPGSAPCRSAPIPIPGPRDFYRAAGWRERAARRKAS